MRRNLGIGWKAYRNRNGAISAKVRPFTYLEDMNVKDISEAF